MKRALILFLALAVVLALVSVVTEGSALAGNDHHGARSGLSPAPVSDPGPDSAGPQGTANEDPGGQPALPATDAPGLGNDGQQMDAGDDSGNQPGWSQVPGWGHPGPPGQGSDMPQGTTTDDPGNQPGWSQVPGPGRRGAPGRGNG